MKINVLSKSDLFDSILADDALRLGRDKYKGKLVTIVAACHNEVGDEWTEHYIPSTLPKWEPVYHTCTRYAYTATLAEEHEDHIVLYAERWCYMNH